jgi:hypothetical protein
MSSELDISLIFAENVIRFSDDAIFFSESDEDTFVSESVDAILVNESVDADFFMRAPGSKLDARLMGVSFIL